MAKKRWPLVLLSIIVMASLQIVVGLASELRQQKARLVKELLHNYTESATNFLRPMAEPDGSDVIFVKWVPLAIIKFQGDDQSIQLRAFLTLSWVDDLLTWDPQDYGDIDYLVLPSTEIWRPNVVLNESVEHEFSSVYHESESVIVFPGGCVFWESYVITTTFCKFGVEAFPFDRQTCGLTFYSSEYGQVHFHPLDEYYNAKGKTFANLFTENGIWNIDNQPLQSCRCVPFSGIIDGITLGVRYTIELRRRSVWFHLFTLFLPCVLLSMLSVFVFCLPVESGEKISFTITILLSLFVYQSIVAEEGPDTGSPIFAYYIVLTIIEGILAIVSTIHVISFHFDVSTIARFDNWVMKSVRRYGTMKHVRKRTEDNNELRPPEVTINEPPEEAANHQEESSNNRGVGGLYRPRRETTEEKRIQMKRKSRVIELERGLAFIFIALKLFLLVVFFIIEIAHVFGGNSPPDESCDCAISDEERSTRTSCLERLSNYY